MLCLTLVGCEPPSPCDDVGSAYAAVQSMVRPELSTPATASFPPLSSVRLAPVNKCEFLGAGYVDTINLAGRPVRTYYRMQLALDRQSGRYRQLSFEFVSM